jgi:putative ABC transport system ATP-binding protein
MPQTHSSQDVGFAQAPILQVSGLDKQVPFAERQLSILSDINLAIGAGESVVIVGASGSGKSTLLGLMAGLDLPSRGKVLIDGVDLTSLNEDGRAAMRARSVGFVFQSFQLVPALTALENVMLPLELAGKPDARRIASDWLQRVGLGQRLQHYPKQLSGGEQQRVALARAFAGNPKILFADEPTGNLDFATGQQICDLLFNLNQQLGTRLVLVTHDQQLAARCGRQIRLHGGALVTAAS